MSAFKEPPSIEMQSHRACAHCRSQKVRCIPDAANPNICQRCARTGRSCLVNPLQKRKQRMRTDTRVAELEREMSSMRAMLNDKNRANRLEVNKTEQAASLDRKTGMQPSENVSHGSRGDNNLGIVAPDNTGSQAAYPTPKEAFSAGQQLLESGTDVIDRGLISMATATHLFDVYRSELFPLYPMVAIPSNMSAGQFRQLKPTLFLAILAAASMKENPDLSTLLDKEILQAYATKTLVQSEKSLELVQSLLISAVWYSPPKKFGQLKYYEYIHMAATMAMDIGIGTRPVPHRSQFGNARRSGTKPTLHHLEDATNPDLSMTPRSNASSTDTSSIESRRTFVSCYTLCTGVALSTRRPNMLRTTSYLKECIEYIKASPEALPSDRVLTAWARLLMIADEIATSFSYDDPGEIASITDLRTQIMLKDYSKRLSAWYSNVPEAAMNSALPIVYWSVRLYLHEIALHVDHSPEDFKAPYQMGTIHPWDGDALPTHVIADTVAECVSCSHNLIEAFLSVDVETLRALPVLVYVRVSFAAFVLAKLCLSASHPESQIGRVLDRSSLRAESLLEKAILHVRAVVGPTTCRIPAIFLALLFKLRQWCLNPTLIEPSRENILDPKTQRYVASKATGMAGTMSTDIVATEERTPRSSAKRHRGISDIVNSTSNEGSASTNIQDHCTQGEESSATTANGMTNNSTASIPTSLDPNDYMQLDQSFFQLFQDMNGMGDLAMTGYDNWSSIPTDLLGLQDDFYLHNTMRNVQAPIP